MPNKKSSSPPAERYVPRIAAAGAPRQVGSQQPPLQTLQRRLRALVVSNAFVTYYSPLIMEGWAKLFGLSLVPFGMVLYMVTIVVSDYILLTYGHPYGHPVQFRSFKGITSKKSLWRNI